MKVSSEKKVKEMYKWFEEVKTPLLIWTKILEYVFLFTATLGIVLGGFYTIKFVSGLFSDVWPQVSIDAKFAGLIALIVFLLGLVVGRKTKKQLN